MRAAASQEDAPNRRSANQARLLGAEIYPVLELEEALYSGRVHIIGNRRAAERNCLPKDALQAGVQAVKFRSLQVASHPARPDSRPEEALIGINISHAVQKFLIKQGGLDGCPAGFEERGELVRRDA